MRRREFNNDTISLATSMILAEFQELAKLHVQTQQITLCIFLLYYALLILFNRAVYLLFSIIILPISYWCFRKGAISLLKYLWQYRRRRMPIWLGHALYLITFDISVLCPDKIEKSMVYYLERCLASMLDNEKTKDLTLEELKIKTSESMYKMWHHSYIHSLAYPSLFEFIKNCLSF